MSRRRDTATGSLNSKPPRNKRKKRKPPHTPVLRREQNHRDAKPLPSIEESAQKGPFDPYDFLSQPTTPSLLSPSPNRLNALENSGSDVSPRDGKTTQPHLSSNPRALARNEDSNEVKRELFTSFQDPVIRQTSVAASLQNTQLRERKLEENGIVELDRDEFALQRFLKVNSELTDLEEILMKGKKRHVFEQIKRNATTKSSSGGKPRLAENDATPTPSARPIPLQGRTTSKKLGVEQHLEVVSKADNIGMETSHPESPQSHENPQTVLATKPPKRKELPGMGLIFNPRPKRPQGDGKHQDMKLPRDLQRREVNMPEVKDVVEKTNDADIDGAIDSAQNWLQRENALEQDSRAKRWAADPNWKRLTTDQADAMRRQASIPPARFYGHPSKLTHSNDRKEIQSFLPNESNHPPATSTEDLRMPKATSKSREEKKKAVVKAIDNEIDSRQSLRDGGPAVEPQAKGARDTVEPSKVKALSKKRKRDTDVSETAVTATTIKNISELPDLPSMKDIIEGSQMAITSSSAQKKKSTKSPRTEPANDVANNAKEPSTPSKSKKRKKVRENTGVHEVEGENPQTKTKKRKNSGQIQESDEATVEKPRSDTLIDRLRRKWRMQNSLVSQEATQIPTPGAAKTTKLDHAPQTAPEPAVEDVWHSVVDEEDLLSPPRPSPSKKRHKSKHHRPANPSPAVDVSDTTPENIEPTAPASPLNPPTNSSFNQLRRRHQSLPLRLSPNTTPATTNSITNRPQPQPIHPHPNLYDLNLHAIRNRLSNLEAAVAANPAPNTRTRTAALKLRLPPLPRAVPHASRVSDAELIEIGKRVNGYERHRGAPYAFSWRGRLYAEYNYLLDRVDGWNYTEKSRVKR